MVQIPSLSIASPQAIARFPGRIAWGYPVSNHPQNGGGRDYSTGACSDLSG